MTKKMISIILKIFQAVDAEEKSLRIESLINSIYSKLVDVEDEFQIVTTSFVVNHFKLKLTNTRVNFDFQDGSSFLIPFSFCNLTQNCLKNEFVTIKVSYNQIIYQFDEINFSAFFKENFNTNGIEWSQWKQ
jgi:hypothetical protein